MRKKIPVTYWTFFYRLPGHFRDTREFHRILQQGRDPLEGLRLFSRPYADPAAGRRDGRHDRLLHVSAFLHRLSRGKSRLRGGQTSYSRITQGDDHPAYDPGLFIRVGGYAGIPSCWEGITRSNTLAPIFGSATPTPSTAGGLDPIGAAWASTTETAGTTAHWK